MISFGPIVALTPDFMTKLWKMLRFPEIEKILLNFKSSTKKKVKN